MGGERPRVTVVTNGNYFSDLALSRLFDRTAERIDYRVVVTSGLRRNRGNRLVEAFQLFRRWGWRYTAYKLATYALPIIAQVTTRSPRFVGASCKRRGIPHVTRKSVNARRVVAEIEAGRPDLIVSYSCPYRIKTPVLDIPRLGSLNVHSSRLPAYAGVCTYIHVLADGIEKTGVTVHEMVERFDAGRIVEQVEIDIEPGLSVFELFSAQCRAAGELLESAIDGIFARDAITGEAQDLARRSYRGEPSAGDVDRLRGNGFRLMTWSDVRSLFGD